MPRGSARSGVRSSSMVSVACRRSERSAARWSVEHASPELWPRSESTGAWLRGARAGRRTGHVEEVLELAEGMQRRTECVSSGSGQMHLTVIAWPCNRRGLVMEDGARQVARKPRLQRGLDTCGRQPADGRRHHPSRHGILRGRTGG